MPVVFSSLCVLGKRIRLTARQWHSISNLKHPELSGKEVLVARAVVDADFVRRSRYAPAVYLYYLAYNEYWLCIICKHENGTGFILTAYLTDRIKEGDEVWTR